MEKIFVDGSSIRKITTIETFEKMIIDMFKGYPTYQYFGIFEGYFGKEIGERIVNILKNDGFLEVVEKTNAHPALYSLTSKGIDLAIHFISLRHSREIRLFTIAIIVLGALSLLVTINQLILTYLQNPIF